MPSYPLQHPVGALMCPVDPVQPEDSLQVAAQHMRESGLAVLPIASGRTLLGVLTQQRLGLAIGDGAEPLSAVGVVMSHDPATIRPYSTVAEGLRVLEATGAAALVVVDDDNQVLGLFSATDMLAPIDMEARPRMVGGMATPFGVYLTNGVVSGGARKWAVGITGGLLFTLFLTASLASDGLDHLTQGIALRGDLRVAIFNGLAFALFLLGLRLLPLSGIHAAEHMVVHAIERGEPLTPEVVARMPRVHPRCGTNFAAGAMIFMGIAGSTIIADQEVRVLLAGLVTLVLWRPLGSLLQYYVTTRKPNAKQIAMGIEAGNQLLESYQKGSHGFPSVWMRLWNSGMPQIIVGSMVASFLLELIAWALGFHDVVRVYFT